LIEEKYRLWFFSFYMKKTLRPLRELFHATGATKTQRSQRFLTTIKILASKIIWCRYNFQRSRGLMLIKTKAIEESLSQASNDHQIRIGVEKNIIHPK
jgi:hypothetical protein